MIICCQRAATVHIKTSVITLDSEIICCLFALIDRSTWQQPTGIINPVRKLKKMLWMWEHQCPLLAMTAQVPHYSPSLNTYFIQSMYWRWHQLHESNKLERTRLSVSFTRNKTCNNKTMIWSIIVCCFFSCPQWCAASVWLCAKSVQPSSEQTTSESSFQSFRRTNVFLHCIAPSVVLSDNIPIREKLIRHFTRPRLSGLTPLSHSNTPLCGASVCQHTLWTDKDPTAASYGFTYHFSATWEHRHYLIVFLHMDTFFKVVSSELKSCVRRCIHAVFR